LGLPEVTKGFERRFEAVRSAYGKTRVDLRTASDLLEELEIDA
jgi:hypothetical protein